MAKLTHGTLSVLAKQKNMSQPLIWNKIYRQNDLELIKEAIEIHNNLLIEKQEKNKQKKENAAALFATIKSEV